MNSSSDGKPKHCSSASQMRILQKLCLTCTIAGECYCNWNTKILVHYILPLAVFTLLCLFLRIGKKIMMPYMNRCPNYLLLLIWSMQTLKCSHYTPIFDDFNWPHLFWVFPVFTANKKVWFPGEAIHGRNICSDYKCSLRLCVWLYSQQLSSFYSKYFLMKF